MTEINKGYDKNRGFLLLLRETSAVGDGPNEHGSGFHRGTIVHDKVFEDFGHPVDVNGKVAEFTQVVEKQDAVTGPHFVVLDALDLGLPEIPEVFNEVRKLLVKGFQSFRVLRRKDSLGEVHLFGDLPECIFEFLNLLRKQWFVGIVNVLE